MGRVRLRLFALGVTDGQGTWRAPIDNSPIPTLVYLYAGVEKGKQPLSPNQMTGGPYPVNIGPFVLSL